MLPYSSGHLSYGMFPRCVLVLIYFVPTFNISVSQSSEYYYLFHCDQKKKKMRIGEQHEEELDRFLCFFFLMLLFWTRSSGFKNPNPSPSVHLFRAAACPLFPSGELCFAFYGIIPFILLDFALYLTLCFAHFSRPHFFFCMSLFFNLKCGIAVLAINSKICFFIKAFK